MKILKHFEEKIKAHKEELFIIVIIIFSGLFGFGMGRLSRIEERKMPIIIKEEVVALENGSNISEDTSVYFVASKNGKKYYFPWCSGVDRISQKNIVRFETREDAEGLGYEKATNCPGL